MAATLSKSDFKIASNCAKKLKYKKSFYPTEMDENEFMIMLAEGGYVIGKLATVIYPGTEITGNTKEALELTTKLLQQDNITLHEAAILAGQKLIRIDILEKKGNSFNLIEVKAKSFNSEEDKSQEKKNLEEYIEDVVFQTMVLQEAYPKASINSFLLLPDKSMQTKIEGLASWFKVKPQEITATGPGKFRKLQVDFIYEQTPEYETKRAMLVEDGLLQLLALNDQVTLQTPIIKNRAEKFLRIINNDFKYNKGDYTIDKNCKGCEYRANESDAKDGFKECWGKLADTTPSIFDLYYGGTVGGIKEPLINQLIKKKKVSLYDFKLEDFVNAKGEVGSRNERQIIQYANTKSNTEWRSPKMKSELKQWQYPLHFIDFETYTGAVPYHKGMRPYETIAFQWSCHTITKEGAAPIHYEWINTEPSFPNFRFAESLMKQIGNNGTPLMWATHENTVLRAILRQMISFEYKNNALEKWLTTITKENDRDGRLVDMNAFTLKNYFHPYMMGRTSIKKTLPAVWNHHPYLYEIPWFKPYYKTDNNGNVLDPYQTLKHLFAALSIEDILAEKELEEVVKEGSAAMKAYQDMMYGPSENKEKLKNQLLEYCKLDTMAMIIIWHHWKH